MAKLVVAEETFPSTPSGGSGTFYFDSTANLPAWVNDAGRKGLLGSHTNASVAAQTAGGFATDTYVTSSDLIIPSFGFQASTVFRWIISASKTAAGVATPIYVVRVGSARTTSDTARLTLTGPAQTAVIDIGTLNILVTIRTIGATGVLQGTAWWDHRGTAANTTTSGTGFANDTTGHVEQTSGSVDMTAFAGQFVGLSVNGGTSAAWSVTQCVAEAMW